MNLACIFSSFNLTSFKASVSAPERYLTFSVSDLIENNNEHILTRFAVWSAAGLRISARFIPDFKAKLNLWYSERFIPNPIKAWISFPSLAITSKETCFPLCLNFNSYLSFNAGIFENIWFNNR